MSFQKNYIVTSINMEIANLSSPKSPTHTLSYQKRIDSRSFECEYDPSSQLLQGSNKNLYFESRSEDFKQIMDLSACTRSQIDSFNLAQGTGIPHMITIPKEPTTFTNLDLKKAPPQDAKENSFCLNDATVNFCEDENMSVQMKGTNIIESEFCPEKRSVFYERDVNINSATLSNGITDVVSDMDPIFHDRKDCSHELDMSRPVAKEITNLQSMAPTFCTDNNLGTSLRKSIVYRDVEAMSLGENKQNSSDSRNSSSILSETLISPPKRLNLSKSGMDMNTFPRGNLHTHVFNSADTSSMQPIISNQETITNVFLGNNIQKENYQPEEKASDQSRGLTEADMFNIRSLINPSQSSITDSAIHHPLDVTRTQDSVNLTNHPLHQNLSTFCLAERESIAEEIDQIQIGKNTQYGPTHLLSQTKYNDSGSLGHVVIRSSQPMFPSPPGTPMIFHRIPTSQNPNLLQSSFATSRPSLSMSDSTQNIFFQNRVIQDNSCQPYFPSHSSTVENRDQKLILDHVHADLSIGTHSQSSRQHFLHASNTTESTNSIRSRLEETGYSPRHISSQSSTIGKDKINLTESTCSYETTSHIINSEFLDMSNKDLNSMIADCMVIDPVRGRVFKCSRPFCSKAYKNPNGLKYHLRSGRCEIETTAPCLNFGQQSPLGLENAVNIQQLSEISGREIKTVKRPYWCRAPNCGRRYKNLNGLKYHARVCHPALSFENDIKGHYVSEA